MPVYEYGCETGHRFEVTQKFSDTPITTCQAYAQPVSKLISAPAIMFKGAGWYITDYSDKLKPTAVEGNSESTTAPRRTVRRKRPPIPHPRLLPPRQHTLPSLRASGL